MGGPLSTNRVPQRSAAVKGSAPGHFRNAASKRLPASRRCATPAASLAPGAAPVTSLAQILLMILDIAMWIIIAHIIMSWLINFQVLNLRQPLVAKIWDGLNRVLEPIYGRIRSYLPRTGGIDFAPLIVVIAIYALRIVIVNNL
jgi:YggT family protein